MSIPNNHDILSVVAGDESERSVGGHALSLPEGQAQVRAEDAEDERLNDHHDDDDDVGSVGRAKGDWLVAWLLALKPDLVPFGISSIRW